MSCVVCSVELIFFICYYVEIYLLLLNLEFGVLILFIKVL